MASNALAVARSIRLFADTNLAPAALSRILATRARELRDDLIRTGQAAPSYATYVDGQLGANEDRVRPDGAILYRFSSLGQAAAFALGFCQGRSPVDSGEFRRSWFLAVNGARWTGNINDIPPDAEVMVTNPLPYARKVDVGHMRMRVPHGIVEAARQATMKKFPAIYVERQFVLIPASLGGGYMLKGRFRRGVRLNSRTRARRDTAAGQPITYPALIMKAAR